MDCLEICNLDHQKKEVNFEYIASSTHNALVLIKFDLLQNEKKYRAKIETKTKSQTDVESKIGKSQRRILLGRNRRQRLSG